MLPLVPQAIRVPTLLLTLSLLLLHVSPGRPFHAAGVLSCHLSPRKNVFSARSAEGDENDPSSIPASSAAERQPSSPSLSSPSPAATPLPRRDLQPPPAATATDWMRLLGTSPRRIALSTLSATGIALAGNLFGVTSTVLSLVPEESVRATGLDTYYPRGDFKRYSSSLYTFVFPKEWIGDTALELQKVQRRTRPLDYSMGSAAAAARRETSVLPDVGTWLGSSAAVGVLNLRRGEKSTDSCLPRSALVQGSPQHPLLLFYLQLSDLPDEPLVVATCRPLIPTCRSLYPTSCRDFRCRVLWGHRRKRPTICSLA